MNERWLPILAVGLFASLIFNSVLLTVFFIGEGAPKALGQATSAGEGFLMATEQVSDQTPVCFVLNTHKPQLLVYKTDTAGQLQLTSVRDIECDFLLRDNYFPRGTVVPAQRTRPPVNDVCRAVKQAGEKEKEKEKGKKEEAKVTPPQEKEEEEEGEKK